MRTKIVSISIFTVLLLANDLFGQIPPEVLEKLPPEVREELEKELKNLPPGVQVTYTEGLPPDFVPPEPISISLPHEYQQQVEVEFTAAMYRGDKLYDSLFINEETKTQSIQSLLGITEDQRQEFENNMDNEINAFLGDSAIFYDSESPEIPEGCVLVDEANGIFLAPIEGYLALYRKVDELGNKIMTETLTPEQIQTARECFLALPSQIEVQLDGMEPVEILNFDAYEALDLTNEQRNLLKMIREESGQEFVSLFKELTETVQTKSASQIEDIRKTLEKLRQHTSRAKARIVSIMKPEQFAKLERMMKELPDKLATIQAELKENAPDDSWKESWKPGDPVPKGARPPRQRKPFPFGLM